MASIAQLAEHALRKRMVVGSIPTGGSDIIDAEVWGTALSAVDVMPLRLAAESKWYAGEWKEITKQNKNE